MKELKIAYGRSSNAKSWKNSVTTWGDLCAKLKTTVRTRETAEAENDCPYKRNSSRIQSYDQDRKSGC